MQVITIKTDKIGGFIMKKIKILIILLSVAFICTGCPDRCEDCHQYITFINDSDENIICQFRGIEEKDTSLCVIYWDNPFVRIYSDNYSSIPCRNIERNCSWEAQLNANNFIQFQVINDSVYQHYMDLFDYNDYSSYNDSIQKYVPILQCYRLTLSDLQRMNWTVTYPPEE
jgi:hypothetical protein